jgi:hypothetical protein
MYYKPMQKLILSHEIMVYPKMDNVHFGENK